MPAIDTDETRAALAGRMARCGMYKNCGSTVPSAVSLPFFEFRGEGSRDATTICKNCPYSVVAHTDEVRAKHHTQGRGRVQTKVCDNFEPHGPFEFDSFYDGCRGWD